MLDTAPPASRSAAAQLLRRLAACVARDHVRVIGDRSVCRCCGQPWPCSPRRLAELGATVEPGPGPKTRRNSKQSRNGYSGGMALGVPSTSPGGHPSVGQLLRAGTTFSFEFFPPKTEAGQRQLWRAIQELEPLRPSFVSVTYGAGGSSRDNTIAATRAIATQTTLVPMAHLTAVNHSRAELRHIVGQLAGVGVRSILALRGDPPGDAQGEWVAHPDGVEYAEDLVRLVRESGDFSVGVAAFPFRHPRSPDIESDTRFFVRKCRAGAEFAITQMVFDAEDYLRLRDRVAAAGCDTPIIAGVMPVTRIGTIERSEQLSGAPFPPALAERFARVASDPAAVRRLGIEEASALCARLLAEGVPGIHFITFNRSTATREVWQNLALDSQS